MKEAERKRTTGKDGREEEKKLGDSSTARSRVGSR